MLLTKYAEMRVLEASRGSMRPSAQVTAGKRTAHRAVFAYEPREGFIYVRSRAISSRCNDNFDEFPAEEIKRAYATFVGKPVFVNHHNEDHRRARGVILDAVLHEDVNPDGSPDTWVEVLMEVDAVKFPKLAKAILAGHIDRTSMGTDVAYSICSVCANRAASPMDYCKHIPAMKGQTVWQTTASGKKEGTLVRELCYGLHFFENSLLVEDPADPTAFFLGVDDRGVGGGYQGDVKATARRKHANRLDLKDSLLEVESMGKRNRRRQRENLLMGRTASRKHAYGEVKAPQQVDTLRPEEDEDGIEPIPPFNDPDLDAAREMDLREELGEGLDGDENVDEALLDEVSEVLDEVRRLLAPDNVEEQVRDQLADLREMLDVGADLEGLEDELEEGEDGEEFGDESEEDGFSEDVSDEEGFDGEESDEEESDEDMPDFMTSDDEDDEEHEDDEEKKKPNPFASSLRPVRSSRSAIKGASRRSSSKDIRMAQGRRRSAVSAPIPSRLIQKKSIFVPHEDGHGNLDSIKADDYWHYAESMDTEWYYIYANTAHHLLEYHGISSFVPPASIDSAHAVGLYEAAVATHEEQHRLNDPDFHLYASRRPAAARRRTAVRDQHWYSEGYARGKGEAQFGLSIDDALDSGPLYGAIDGQSIPEIFGSWEDATVDAMDSYEEGYWDGLRASTARRRPVGSRRGNRVDPFDSAQWVDTGGGSGYYDGRPGPISFQWQQYSDLYSAKETLEEIEGFEFNVGDVNVSGNIYWAGLPYGTQGDGLSFTISLFRNGSEIGHAGGTLSSAFAMLDAKSEAEKATRRLLSEHGIATTGSRRRPVGSRRSPSEGVKRVTSKERHMPQSRRQSSARGVRIEPRLSSRRPTASRRKTASNFTEMSFSDFRSMVSGEDIEGLVLLGAGGDLQEWVDGVTGMLNEQGIANGEVFTQPTVLTTSGGRTDLALLFAEGADLDIGRLAMWRLSFGDASWISDYVVNYEDQHVAMRSKRSNHPRAHSSSRRVSSRRKTAVKYPEVNVPMVGEDGNAFAILGRVIRALKRAGVSREEIDLFHSEATSGDYDNLLQTVMSWVSIDEYDDYDDNGYYSSRKRPASQTVSRRRNTQTVSNKKRPSRRVVKGQTKMSSTLRTLAEVKRLLQEVKKNQRTVQAQVNYIGKAAGLERQLKVVRKRADVENPAQPIPEPTPEAAAYSTDETRDHTDADLLTPGGVTEVSDVSEDYNVDLLTPGGVHDVELTDGGDVTVPVAGTTEQRPYDETVTNAEVQYRDLDTELAYDESQPLFGEEAKEARFVAALRLARLRLQAGIASGDDLTLATSIAQSKMKTGAIRQEIKTLNEVVKAGQKKPVSRTAARRLVPKAAGRTAPSMVRESAVTSPTAPLAVSSEEFLWD